MKYLNQFIQKPQNMLLLALIAVLLARLATLEVGDLLDPTETRYATISQNMLLSGDWITPRLPENDELTPYLSKPPLHFWLTTIAYYLFGIDEWSSRLVSFLGLSLIAISLIVFSRRFLRAETGYLAALICVTSPLMFFLGGSSTVDVTFAAFITAALISYAFFAFQEKKSYSFAMLFFLFSALSFLTKGPAGPVLIALPILATTLYSRDFSSILRLPWLSGIILTIVVTVPWFYFLEQANPGATSYFFITENLHRFTSKNYGGNHGAAHIRPYGSIWWMAALAMLPWILFLLPSAKRYYFYMRSEFKKNPIFFFILSMAFSPLVFFTFARSILPAYTTPAIPGISLVLASLLWKIPFSKIQHRFTDHPLSKTPAYKPMIFACSLTFIMITGLIVSAPYIQKDRSAGDLLQILSEKTKSKHPIVATISNRDLSPYWLEGAHEEELSKPIQVVHATTHDIKTGKFKHLVIRDKRLDEEGHELLKKLYKKEASSGKWHWYIRKDADILA